MVKKASLFLILSVIFFFSCSSSNGIRINTLDKDFTGQILKSGTGNCIVDYDDIDKLTGKRITGLQPEKIFVFTPENIKKYFTDRPFMTGKATLSKTNDKELFLTLFFIIDTKNIKAGYNGIAVNNMVRITMINGEKVFLENILSEPAEIDLKNNKMTYSAVFPVDKSNLKVLKKYEIDKIGILWNGGFEEYDIYNIDFFIRQYECLKQIN
jgi:hypothetical protein